MQKDIQCLRKQVLEFVYWLDTSKFGRFTFWTIVWFITTTIKNGGTISVTDLSDVILKVVEDGLFDVFK
jgi:hypothetical protein